MSHSKLIFILFSLFLITQGNGLVIKGGNEVVVGVDEVIDDDLIALARSVEIKGKVNGDLFAFGQDVMVEGEVSGSIYSSGASLKLIPKSSRSVWAFCGSLKAGGNINNLLFFGGELNTLEDCTVKKDILVFGGEVNVNGDVHGMIRGNIGKFNLKGKIKGGDISAKSIKIDSSATVLEKLIIRSEKEPLIDQNARILGMVEYKKLEKAERREKSGFPLGNILWILFFIGKIVIGIIIIALFSPYIRQTNKILVESTWKSLGLGFLAMVIIPVATVITLATIVGIPIAIFGIFIFLTLVYISGIIFATGFGEWIIKIIRRDTVVSPYLALILGLVLTALVSMIPYLGFLIHLPVLFLGTGILVIFLHRLWKESLKTLEAK